MAKEETPEERSARIAANRAEIAEEDARLAAEQVRVERDFVASSEFRALLPLVRAANRAHPLHTEIQHIAVVMGRLADRIVV